MKKSIYMGRKKVMGEWGRQFMRRKAMEGECPEGKNLLILCTCIPSDTPMPNSDLNANRPEEDF